MTLRLLSAMLALAGFATATPAQTLLGKPGNFPLTISQPGSYKLTQNLVVPGGTHGIVITASDVTLDLNGFTVSGNTSCGGGYTAMYCTGSPDSVGIEAGAANMVSIRNGQVSHFGIGVRLGFGGVVDDLRIGTISSIGLVVGTGSTARNLNVFYVKGVGITASASLLQNVSVAYAVQAVEALDGLIIGSTFTNVVTGIHDGSYGQYGKAPAMRETFIHASAQPTIGGVRSLGSNICNASTC